MSSEVLKILNDIEKILQLNQSGDEALSIIWEYVQQKRIVLKDKVYL